MKSIGMTLRLPAQRADLAEQSAAATVAHVLKLDRESILVGEIQLRGSSLGAAPVRHPPHSVGYERGALLFIETVLGSPISIVK